MHESVGWVDAPSTGRWRMPVVNALVKRNDTWIESLGVKTANIYNSPRVLPLDTLWRWFGFFEREKSTFWTELKISKRGITGFNNDFLNTSFGRTLGWLQVWESHVTLQCGQCNEKISGRLIIRECDFVGALEFDASFRFFSFDLDIKLNGVFRKGTESVE